MSLSLKIPEIHPNLAPYRSVSCTNCYRNILKT